MLLFQLLNRSKLDVKNPQSNHSPKIKIHITMQAGEWEIDGCHLELMLGTCWSLMGMNMNCWGINLIRGSYTL